VLIIIIPHHCSEYSLDSYSRHGVDWGGHVHPTFAEVAPEIDTNPTSRGGGGVGPIKVFLTLCDCVSFVTVVKL